MLLALVVMVSSISFSMFLSVSPVQAQPCIDGEEDMVTGYIGYIVKQHPELLEGTDTKFLEVLQAAAPWVWAESMKESRKESLLGEFHRHQRGHKDGWIEYDAISTIKVPTEAEIEAMDKDELDAEYERLYTMPLLCATPPVISAAFSHIMNRVGKIIEERPVSPPARPMFPAQPFSSSSESDEEDLGAIPGPVRPGARPVPARAPLGVLPRNANPVVPKLRAVPFINITRVKGTRLQDILARYNTVSEADLTADQRQRRTEIIQELQRRREAQAPPGVFDPTIPIGDDVRTISSYNLGLRGAHLRGIDRTAEEQEEWERLGAEYAHRQATEPPLPPARPHRDEPIANIRARYTFLTNKRQLTFKEEFEKNALERELIIRRRS